MQATILAAVTEIFCNTNGCDLGETVLGVTLILAAMCVLIVFLGAL